VIKRIAEVDIPPDTGDFRLMSRRAVDEVLRLHETHGFLRASSRSLASRKRPSSMTAMLGPAAPALQPLLGLVADRVNGTWLLALPAARDLLLGLAFFVFAMLLGLTYLILAFANVKIPWGNPTLVMLISLFSGIQLLSLGVMGEYVGRIYDEVKRRPMFVIETLEGSSASRRSGRSGTSRGAPQLTLPPVCILAGGRGTRLGALTDRFRSRC
jgi:dolichol-phosphate mannosyltransferase